MIYLCIAVCGAHALPTDYTPILETGSPAESGIDTVVVVLVVTILSLLAILLLSLIICLAVRWQRTPTEDEISREEDNQAYLELNSEEQELYFQSKDYLATNPFLTGELTLSQNLSIQERGVQAWEFIKDPMLTNNDLLIVNKSELNFFKNYECSATTNLPVPSTNEVYYFESKIYTLPRPEETLVSIGLGVKPYPWFRLPGRHLHTVSYDSDGYRRHNQPFPFINPPPFPSLLEGDVVGIGYRVRSGIVFFTRNGKKVSETKLGGHLKNFKPPHGGQLFPIIGANNLCSVHVNLGQRGFVFIEGNVKKWGFAPVEGSGPAPPAYNKFNADILLERSEIDEDNDLLDRANDFPPNFWEVHANSHGKGQALVHKNSYNAYSENSSDERITMNSLVPETPPNYESNDHEDYAVPEENEGQDALQEQDVIEELRDPEEAQVQQADESADEEGEGGDVHEEERDEVGDTHQEDRTYGDASGNREISLAQGEAPTIGESSSLPPYSCTPSIHEDATTRAAETTASE